MFWRYRAHLEAELVKQELLLKFVINDKEKIILRQDEEIRLLRAECERYKLLLLPRLAPQQPGSKPRPLAPVGESSWTAYLNQHMREQEELAKKEKANGVPQQVGTDVHEPAGSKSGRSNGEPEPESAPVLGQQYPR